MATEKKNNLPEKYKAVVSCIRVGKENATLLSDICSIANIESERQAYSIIEQLVNRYGYPIVASRSGKYRGYFIPANDREFYKALRTFRAEYMSMIERYNNLLDNYKKQNEKGA